MVIEHKKKVFCAVLLIILASVIYIYIHGTENLFILQIIQSYGINIPIIKPKIIHNLIIKNYLIDALWFISFLLLVSIDNSKTHLYLALIVAIFLEVLQFYYPSLGTFDIYDIALYLITFFGFTFTNKF